MNRPLVRVPRLAAAAPLALVAASLVLAGTALAHPAAAATARSRAARPPTLNDGERFVRRPATLVGWTFDGSQVFGGPSDHPPHGYYPGGSVGRIEWTSWTPTEASGEGVVWTDDCEPSCGDGSWHGTATRVLAYRPRRGTFQRMRFECACDEPMGTRARFRLVGDLPPQWRIVNQW